MSECLHPRNDREVQQYIHEREADLREYLVWLAGKGTLVAFGFREDSGTPTEQARMTVARVQQELNMRTLKENNPQK